MLTKQVCMIEQQRMDSILHLVVTSWQVGFIVSNSYSIVSQMIFFFRFLYLTMTTPDDK